MNARSVIVSLAALGMVVGGVAAPAQAKPLESGSWEFSDSFTFDDCGFEVAVEEAFTGRYVIKDATPKTGGQYFQVQQQVRFFGTFTNVETDDYFTISWHTLWKEMPGRVVSEDGNIVTYRTHEAGAWDVIRDSSGTVRYRSTGLVVFEYVYDTLGDSEPGGEVLSEEFVRTSGLFETFDADFCEIVTELIG